MPNNLPAPAAEAIKHHTTSALPRLVRLWDYYRNPARASGALAQEAGLPARITGAPTRTLPDGAPPPRREVVIENDIGWHINTLVDFMFGKPLAILSTARDETQRDIIQRTLDRVFENSGGIALLQDVALIGHIYGFVDVALHVDPSIRLLTPTSDPDVLASLFTLQVLDPLRTAPILSPSDSARASALAIHSAPHAKAGLLLRLNPFHRAAPIAATLLTADGTYTFSDDRLSEARPSLLPPGELPFIHIQNMAQPFRYEGLSDVEPLIPLQDELNTRLSDRANRISIQSFKMYLARGLEAGATLSVSPGVIWTTENPDAHIEEFGGDSATPGEEAHISEIREALDKVSGVPPLATGVVKARIGNLTSANALRITLMGVLGKTARKRVTYGRGISELCRLILAALDHHHILPTAPQDRSIRLEWPDPLPIDPEQTVRTALLKAELGVPRPRLLTELGYAPTDPGVQ